MTLIDRSNLPFVTSPSIAAPTPTYDPLVMSVFNFNRFDLNANRQQRLSDRQFRWLHRRRLRVSLRLLIPGSALLFSALMLEAYALGFAAGALAALGLVLLLPAPVLMSRGTAVWLRYMDDLVKNPVAYDIETIHLDVKGNARFTLCLRHRCFKLNKQQFLALKNREVYCVYYTPRTHHLLSVEQVSRW